MAVTCSNGHRCRLYDRLLFLVLLSLALIGLTVWRIADFSPTVSTFRTSVGYPPAAKKVRTRFAYVFYVASSDYSCYALINAHRLIFDLKTDPRIDIVILATNQSRIDRLCPTPYCSFPEDRLKIQMVSHEMVKLGMALTDNVYYMESYVRFEAFRLYNEYDRVVILDADGLVMQNMDHLFQLDLGEFDVAAALAHYLSNDWISSVLLVVDPSKAFYDHIRSFLTPKQIDKVAKFSEGAHYDMDILNYVLDRGNLTKRLSKYYALLDSYFFEDDSETRRRENELNMTYYIHFTVRKPLMYLETRPWPLEIDSSNSSNTTVVPEPQSYGFPEAVYHPFWRAFDKRCRALVQRIPTVPPAEKDSGMSYPDPDMVMEFINNSSDLIIAHL